MKKLISIAMMALVCVVMSAQVNYYVTEDGDNTNDGLTVETAFASIQTAADSAIAEGVASSYIVNVGSGEFTGACRITFERDEKITFKLVGDGAGASIIQMGSDSLFYARTATFGKAVGAGRIFFAPQNKNDSLLLEIEDLTMRNCGYSNTNGGGIFNLGQAVHVDVTIKRCNILRAAARAGALVQRTNGTGVFTFEDCFVSEMLTINNQLYISPIYLNSSSSLVAKNTVFSNCVKASAVNSASKNQQTTSYGSVINFIPKNTSAYITLVNNTFIGDSILNSNMTVTQSAVSIRPIVATEATIANNLFVGNTSASSTGYYDLIVGGTLPTFVANSNNVMTSQIDTLVNSADSTLAYDSEAINFTMDGAYPKLSTTSTGVNYVKANGDSVFAMGLVSVATLADIAGTTRSATAPCVGAYEATEGIPTQLGSAIESTISVYPNPTTGLVTITGVDAGASVELYTQLGQRVLSSTLNGNDLDLSNINGGMYILRVTDASGNSGVQRIVVR